MARSQFQLVVMTGCEPPQVALLCLFLGASNVKLFEDFALKFEEQGTQVRLQLYALAHPIRTSGGSGDLFLNFVICASCLSMSDDHALV